MLPNIIITDSGFTDNIPESEVLENIGTVKKIDWTSEAELVALTRNADALLVQWAPITRQVIENLERCKLIVRYGIGVDNVDLEAARQHNIPVCNVPDYCIDEVADHTITLALSALRQVSETDRLIREGRWSIMLPRPVPPFSALRFSLLGFGRIAKETARRATALGFKVSAYDPFVSHDTMKNENVKSVPIEELLADADILSLHLPLTGETHHILNEQSLAKLKKNVLIINTSRGGLIDLDALAKAVSEKQIWGAALDVFEIEPLPASHTIREIPGITLSSHVAWYSSQSIPVLQRKAAEEIKRFFTGQNPVNIVK